MLTSAGKSKHITDQFIEPYFVKTDSAGTVIAACDKFASLLSEKGIEHCTSQNLLSIFFKINDQAPGFQTDIQRNGFPKTFDLPIRSGSYNSAIIRWISSPLILSDQEKGWQLTGMEISTAADDPEYDNNESYKKEKIFTDSIINNMPGIFYLFDHSGKFLRWNRRLELVSGFNDQEIASMSPVDFFMEKDRAYISSRIEKAFAEGVSDAEANLVTKIRTEIPHYFTAQLIIFEGRPCLIGMGIDISERKREEEKIKLSNEEYVQKELNKHKSIARTIINAQEKERAEIGQELHNNVNQILSTGKLFIELAKTTDTNRLDLLESCSENISNAINEIRKISTALTPSSIEDLGLLDSIDDLVARINATKSINAEFYPVGWSDDHIGNGLKLALFRIIQEQVNNVLKHSGANNLIIELEMDEYENAIKLNISDDGKGFDAEKIKTKRSLGFSNIIGRTDLFDGSISIVTAPEQGCKLNVQIPIHNSLLNRIYEQDKHINS
jgi:PAS domain S-box-containing protein